MSKVYTGLDCVVKFRCSASLRDAIRDGAKASGMDVSTYIRACLWRCCPSICQNSQNGAEPVPVLSQYYEGGGKL